MHIRISEWQLAGTTGGCYIYVEKFRYEDNRVTIIPWGPEEHGKAVSARPHMLDDSGEPTDQIIGCGSAPHTAGFPTKSLRHTPRQTGGAIAVRST